MSKKKPQLKCMGPRERVPLGQTLLVACCLWFPQLHAFGVGNLAAFTHGLPVVVLDTCGRSITNRARCAVELTVVDGTLQGYKATPLHGEGTSDPPEAQIVHEGRANIWIRGSSSAVHSK